MELGRAWVLARERLALGRVELGETGRDRRRARWSGSRSPADDGSLAGPPGGHPAGCDAISGSRGPVSARRSRSVGAALVAADGAVGDPGVGVDIEEAGAAVRPAVGTKCRVGAPTHTAHRRRASGNGRCRGSVQHGLGVYRFLVRSDRRDGPTSARPMSRSTAFSGRSGVLGWSGRRTGSVRWMRRSTGAVAADR